MDFKQKTEHIVQKLKEELSGIRANRPTSGLVENIGVEYYGQTMPLKQAGSISVKPPREIHITAWDKEGAAAIAKGIETSSLGLTANTDGMTIRVFLPELSTERREELSKHVKKITESYKIQVRAAREDANKEIDAMEKAGKITEDDKFKKKEQTQKETSKANEEIEIILERKLKEINE